MTSIERMAAERVARVMDGLEAAVRDLAPAGVTVQQDEDGLVISGKGLRRRLVADAGLRSIGLIVKERFA